MFWLLLILILLLLFAVPAWPYSRRWGYRPVGALWVILLIFMFLWLIGIFAVAV